MFKVLICLKDMVNYRGCVRYGCLINLYFNFFKEIFRKKIKLF